MSVPAFVATLVACHAAFVGVLVVRNVITRFVGSV